MSGQRRGGKTGRHGKHGKAVVVPVDVPAQTVCADAALALVDIHIPGTAWTRYVPPAHLLQPSPDGPGSLAFWVGGVPLVPVDSWSLLLIEVVGTVLVKNEAMLPVRVLC